MISRQIIGWILLSPITIAFLIGIAIGIKDFIRGPYHWGHILMTIMIMGIIGILLLDGVPS